MNPFELEGDVLEPGILIQCTTAHGGGSAAFRIITHRGATVDNAPGGLRKAVLGEMSMLRGAIYTDRASAMAGNRTSNPRRAHTCL